MGSFKVGSPASAAISYVESLHQNSRATLLYGKNNVLVLPVSMLCCSRWEKNTWKIFNRRRFCDI